MGETAADQCHFPTVVAAEWHFTGAGTMLLEKEESNSFFGPVCGQACLSALVEDLHSLLNVLNDAFFGLFEQLLQLIIPIEWGLGFQEVSEWSHSLRHRCVVADLVYESKPRSDVCDIPRHWELHDGIKIFAAKPHLIGGDRKSREFYDVLRKLELLWIECDSISAALI